MTATEAEATPLHRHLNPREEVPLAGDADARVADWFERAGLGLFIHWDHASQQGLELSWPLVGVAGARSGRATDRAEEYHASASTFDPERWDPVELARLARAAHMKYAVFTARHHSGWSAWPSGCSDRTILTSPYGQRGGDLVRDYVDAFRAEGIRIGLYYSLSDWGHPDYAAWTDDQRPYQQSTGCTCGRGCGPRMGTAGQWDRYRQYVKDQLTELLTSYGPIDLLWFDGEWERTQDQWGTEDLERHIRALAPGVVINDRLLGKGDFRTPEQYIPAQSLVEPWECCMTMCLSWGHVPEDTDYKTEHEIIRTLAEVVSRGGNLLINVGPRGDGSLVPEQQGLLAGLGDWMSRNAASVVDVEPGLEPWQFYGPSTRRGTTVYLHLLARPVESVTVRGVPVRRLIAVRVLDTGRDLEFTRRTTMHNQALQDPLGEIIVHIPDVTVHGTIPVLELDFGGPLDEPRPLRP